MTLQIIQTPSANFNERQHPLDMLVLHYTGMKDGPTALARMLDSNEPRVSAHYMVEEDGRVFQLVDESMRAWQAGRSWWRGDEDLNSRSIGIEIVNGGHDFGLPPFPDVQIEAVIALCQGILGRWAIPPERIVEGLQRDLAAIGYRILVNGVFDENTAAVVRAFQRRWRPERVNGEGDTETVTLANSVAALVAATE